MPDQPLSRMSIDDLWYKNAIIYCLDVEKYQDANGDERQKVFAAFEVFDGQHSRAHNDGAHHVSLGPYEWRWFRVGGADNVLNRSDLDLLPGAGGKPGAGPSQGAAAPRDSPAPCNLLPVESVA